MEENHQPLGRLLGPVEEPAPQPSSVRVVGDVPSQPHALAPAEAVEPAVRRHRQPKDSGRRRLILRIVLLVVLLVLIILGLRYFMHEEPRALLVNPPAVALPGADSTQPSPTAP